MTYKPPTYWKVPLGAWDRQPTFLIGGGASLTGFDFERLRIPGTRTIAINTAFKYAPWADMMFFADQRWYEWNHSLLSTFHQPIVTRTSIKNPKVPIYRVGRDSTNALSRAANAVAGFCSGGCGINLAYLLGGDPLFLLGYDMRPGNFHTDHLQPHKDGQHVTHFLPAIERMAVELRKEGRRVFNTNPNSAMRCFPFIPLEEVMSMSLDELSKVEKAKYESVWEDPSYHKISPGEREVERAFKMLEMKEGDTLTDFGSGPCRATKWFRDHGIRAVGVDLAQNASEHPDVPVIEASLWAMDGRVPASDYGFCCDVMEHIPPEKVEQVLAQISKRTKKAAYFRIATRPDGFGPRMLGQPLHLTVKPWDWWRRKLGYFYHRVDVIQQNPGFIVLLGRSAAK